MVAGYKSEGHLRKVVPLTGARLCCPSPSSAVNRSAQAMAYQGSQAVSPTASAATLPDMRTISTIALTLGVLLLGVALFIYSGPV
jgi:hypothetical protein